MDSIIVVENESGDRQDFTTIQVCIYYIYLIYFNIDLQKKKIT